MGHSIKDQPKQIGWDWETYKVLQAKASSMALRQSRAVVAGRCRAHLSIWI